MKKCSVGSTRKRSAGSKRLAASATAAEQTSSALTSSALSRLGFTRGTRKHDAEDERRHAEKTGANEKESVRVEQRAAGRQALDPHAREPLRELANVGVRRAQQGVLRRSIAETRQARHVRDQRDAGEADAEVVGGDHRAEHAQVWPGVR